MRIAVCIPCYKPHVIYLKKCLDSIENQSRKPDIVSISIYECDIAPTLPEYSFPVRIQCNPNKQCEGKNRNLASSILTDIDILTFFDADDIMHPSRIEIMEIHFKNGIDGFIHDHKKCASVQYRDTNLSSINWEPTTSTVYTDSFTTTKDFICGRVFSPHGVLTYGHFSCRKSVWDTMPYPEQYGRPEHYGLGVDSEYVYNFYTQGYRLGYCPDKLSYYVRDDFPIEKIRNPQQEVYTGYQNSEIQNLINYLQSDRSPKRQNPIYIIDSVNIYSDNTEKKILYNIEQLTREKILHQSISRMKADDVIEVWDYSIANVSILKNYGIQARYVPMRLPIDTIVHYSNYRLSSEYDIVFCGQLSDYRDTILRQLEQRGKTVKRIDSIYTEERDRLIGKAKLLINIHYNEDYRIFESIRCEPWIASGMKVLSETSIDDSPRCICVPYEELVDKACELTSQ